VGGGKGEEVGVGGKRRLGIGRSYGKMKRELGGKGGKKSGVVGQDIEVGRSYTVRGCYAYRAGRGEETGEYRSRGLRAMGFNSDLHGTQSCNGLHCKSGGPVAPLFF